MTKGREVGAYLFLVPGFLEATRCITAFGCEHVALYRQGIVAVPTPFAAEIEKLDVFPLLAKAGEGIALGLVAEVQFDAVARVVGPGIGQQTQFMGVDACRLRNVAFGDRRVVEGFGGEHGNGGF